MSVPKTDIAVTARPHRFRMRMLGVLRVLVAAMPPWLGHWVADRWGDLVMRFAGKSRRAAISNMRHVLGPVPPAVLKKTVRGVFHNVMRSYYDLARAPNLTDEQIDAMVDFDDEGWKRVLAIHKQGRGIVLVSGHFGAFDEITQVLGRHGLPVTVLIAQIKPAWLSDFITNLRMDRGLRMVLVKEDEEGSGVNLAALKESIRILKHGEVLGVVADRNMEQRGVSIPFFGQEAMVAAGVAKMALRTKSVLVTSFCTRLPHNRFSVTFDEPIEPVGSASNEEDIRNVLMQIFSRFENHVSRHPDQWILLQPVWKDDRVTRRSET